MKLPTRFPLHRLFPIVALSAFCLPFTFSAAAQSSQPPPKPVVPTVSADLGDCSASFVVTDAQNKPLYNVEIDLTFRYGFMNFRKQTLTIYTNTEGQGRFAGLPNQVKKPLVFQIHLGTSQTTVTDDPGVTCTLKKTVALPG